MKINEWIEQKRNRLIAIMGIALFFGTSALAQDHSHSSVIEKLSNTFESIQANPIHSSESAWTELSLFQNELWRAMALDPAYGAAVPVSQVPKNLFSAELNEALMKRLDSLKKSPIPAQARAQFEFEQYIQLAEKMMTYRNARQFPQARAIAKRGTLDSVYEMLSKKVSQNLEGETQAVYAITPSQHQQLTSLVGELKSSRQIESRDANRKDVFANGNQFILLAVAAVMGFFIGIAGYRMNPDFFQKFLDQQVSSTPTATTHNANGVSKLDYARWLKEFEEILTRLKSSQLSHERRIEEVVVNSEKVSQHALALYADARIKNEANLEFRMSNLLREIQHTFEQSRKLQAGDRAQINLMLEHCLRLCDGIENNAIHFDRQKLIEPPQMRA